MRNVSAFETRPVLGLKGSGRKPGRSNPRSGRAAWKDGLAVVIRKYGPAAILALTWLFLLWNLDLGWLPNDDGTLAHTADRVRSGQIPHVDFDEPYTGALSYFNASVLSLLGDNLMSLRYPFIALVGVWMVVLDRIANRVLGTFSSAWAVTVIVGTSVFMHLSPMPTWYNVVLGTFAIHFTIKFEESGLRWWLLASGLTIGVSALVKSNGLVVALAVGFALAVRAVRSGDTKQRLWGRFFMRAAVLAVTLLLISSPTVSRMLLLLGPMVCLMLSEWTAPQSLQRASNTRPALPA